MAIQYRDPKQSRAQVRSFAVKVLKRLHALGAASHTLDDVEQELWLAWCTACERYDPAAGTKFSTFLFNGMRLHINRYVEKNFERFHDQTTALSLDYSEDGGDEGGRNASFSESVADPNDTPDVVSDRERNFAYAMTRLSPRAQQFITILKDQPQEILNEVRRLDDKAEHAKKAGLTYANPHRLASFIVFDFMGASRFERKKILDEVQNLGELLTA